MDTETRSSAQLSYVSIITAVGGFLAFIGVFLGWFDVTGHGTQSGLDHWTGKAEATFSVVLMFAGIFHMVFKDRGTKRTAALVAAICGILGVFFAAMAFAQMGSVYDPDPGTSAAFGLYVSLVGALIGAVGGIAAWSGTKS